MLKQKLLKISRIIGKIFLSIFFLLIIFRLEGLLGRNYLGINLPFGWDHCYGYKYFGFPFSWISYPQPGLLCLPSHNPIALILNLLFPLLIIYIFYRLLRVIYHKIRK